MRKRTECKECGGSGMEWCTFCDKCGSDKFVGYDINRGKELCQNCHSNALTQEEIDNL